MPQAEEQKTTWSPEEREIYRPPQKLTTAEWAEANRELSVLTSASAGAYSLGAVPFFREILNAIDDRDTEAVVIQKSTQIGGTELVISWLGRCADQDPGPAMIVLADEDTANEICERRIQPMMRSTRALRKLIIESKFNQNQITLRNNFSLTMAWASSIARTASRPIRYLVMDEITKPGYSQSGAEGDVIGRVEQRTETFPNRKKVMLSTPTAEGDNLDKQMQGCDAVYDYHVPCPRCGSYQPLRFSAQEYTDEHGQKKLSGSVVWQQGLPIAEAAETALYQCGECKSCWKTSEKNTAVGHGRWIARRGTGRKRVGFYVSRLYSLFPGGRLENLARDFLDCEGNPTKLQVFVNNALGEHWTEQAQSSTEEQILAARADIEPLKMPQTAIACTLAVDVQKLGFWYSLRAWSRDATSWLLSYGFLPDWSAVEAIAYDSGLPIWRIGVDTGGGEREASDITSTEEVYQWIIENRSRGVPIFPTKGASKDLAGKCHLGKPLETMPSGRVIRSRWALQVLSIDTGKCKDEYFWRTTELTATASPGAAWLHRETGPEYARQILAEKKKKVKGAYEWVRTSRDNHYLDCETIHLALIDRAVFGGLTVLKSPSTATPTAPRPAQPTTPNPFTSGTMAGGNPYTGGR